VDTLHRLLREAGQPLTLAELRKNCGDESLNSKKVQALLDAEVQQGRAFSCAPKGKMPRYWSKNEEQEARAMILQFCATPRTLKEVLDHLTLGPDKDWREGLLERMQEDGQLFVHPPAPKTRTARVGAEAPDLSSFFTPGIMKPLRTVFKTLSSFGISLERMLEALGAELRKSAPAEAEKPARKRRAEAEAEATTEEAPPPEAEDETALPPPLPTPSAAESRPSPELRDLILKGIHDLEPNADNGVAVFVRELREHLPAEYRDRTTFSKALHQLATENMLMLHLHANPSELSDAERAELLVDGEGHYVVSVSLVKQPAPEMHPVS
jgi:hypothetical protein